MKTIKDYIAKCEELPIVTEFFGGHALPHNFVLPNNILVFYHSWRPGKSYIHMRYGLVITFSELSYGVDHEIYTMKPGMVLFIKPHQSRYVEPSARSYERLFITFELASPQTYLPVSPLAKMSESSWLYLDRIIQYFKENDSVRLSLELTGLLLELSKQTLPYQSRKISKTVSNTIRYINDNLSKSFDIQKIADHLYVSESNLRLIFRKEMGLSLGKYIASKRLESAKYHLLRTNMSIEEIALECGYETIYAFSHFFKKNTGIAPGYYRHKFVDSHEGHLTEIIDNG